MTASQQDYTPEETLDIKKYIYLFLSHWRWFVLSVCVCLLLAFVYVRYATNIYSTNNSVLLLEKEDALGSMSSIMQEFGGMGGKTSNLDNQIAILQSYTLVRQTLERLDYQVSYFDNGTIHDVEIFDACPFRVKTIASDSADTIQNKGLNENIYIKIVSSTQYSLEIPRDTGAVKLRTLNFGEVFETPHYKFTLEKHNNFVDSLHIDKRFMVVLNDYNSLTNSYKKDLTVSANSKKSSIMDLTITGTVPEKIVDFLNTLIQVAIENGLKDKDLTSLKTIQFIDHQLASITDSLSFAETNLESFRSNNQVINISEEGTVALQKMEEQRSKQILIKTRLKYYDYLQKSIKDKNFNDLIIPSVVGIQDQLLNNLVNQLSSLYSERQVIEFSARENHPSLQIINSQITTAIKQLNDNVNSMIESTRIELREVESEIARIERDIKHLPNTERQMIAIQRQFQLNDNLFNFLLQKRAEVGITKAANIPDLKFVDHALIDNVKQTAPKKPLILLIALFLALCIPATIILTRDFFKDSVSDIDTIHSKTGIPLLASIIHNKYENGIIVNRHPKSAIVESFRTARTNLAFFLKKKASSNIISFTSTISGEGKSFCALNLAGIIAMNNKRVLVVGLDLRKPTLHKYLETNKTKGLTDYLIGNQSFEDILNPTPVKGCDIIFAGTIPPNPLEMLEGEAFAGFMDKVSHMDYDYIILDTPPIGLVADTLSIAKYCDLNIFVVRQNFTPKNALEFITHVQKERKLTNLCILANDIEGNGYGYRYSSNYRDHSYYVESEEKPRSRWQQIWKVVKG
ncbi:MAG: polysaccharide biosynthesis tyrosine autokinase [Bacteroidales bacterium]|jgi:capsular exopolysaccharide synthesis family protein|nr:polysaccharide biosynthesis tyrosine autokinase [Bacteroidales bacterium]